MENRYGIIYKITNKVNGKVYIGQTIQKNPLLRIKAHFRKCKSKDLVYESYCKYGVDSMEYEILCSALSQKNLDELEVYFIDKYSSLAPKGYNIKRSHQMTGEWLKSMKKRVSSRFKGKPASGQNAKGHKKSKEHIQKMSEIRKGFTSDNRKNASKMLKFRGKRKVHKILAVNISTNLEICFLSMHDASIFLDLNPRNINAVVYRKNNRSQHKGWKFTKIKKTIDKKKKV